MNVELLDTWVAALESGKYKHGRGYLRVDDCYCATGVLCDLVDPTLWKSMSGFLPGGKTVYAWQMSAWNMPLSVQQMMLPAVSGEPAEETFDVVVLINDRYEGYAPVIKYLKEIRDGH